jgi:hypothetical protein
MDIDGFVPTVSDGFLDSSKNMSALGCIAREQIDEGVHTARKPEHRQSTGDFKSLEHPGTTEDL